jgi:hypothetical protein
MGLHTTWAALFPNLPLALLQSSLMVHNGSDDNLLQSRCRRDRKWQTRIHTEISKIRMGQDDTKVSSNAHEILDESMGQDRKAG